MVGLPSRIRGHVSVNCGLRTVGDLLGFPPVRDRSLVEKVRDQGVPLNARPVFPGGTDFGGWGEGKRYSQRGWG